MALTNDQVLDIMSAGVLLGRYAGELSGFEAQIVAEVCARWLDFKREAQVTDEEWAVVHRSIEAMRKRAPLASAIVEVA